MQMFLAWTTTYITMLIKGSVLPRKQVFSLAISQHTLALSHPDGLSVSWTCCILLLLGGFVSNASFSELSVWTLSFTSFKTLLQHHLLTFADFPWAGSLPTPLHPHILLHTIKCFSWPEVPFSNCSLNPLTAWTVCFSWFAKSLLLSLVGLINFLNEYIFFMDCIISCTVHINEITAIKYSQPSVFADVEPWIWRVDWTPHFI